MSGGTASTHPLRLVNEQLLSVAFETLISAP